MTDPERMIYAVAFEAEYREAFDRDSCTHIAAANRAVKRAWMMVDAVQAATNAASLYVKYYPDPTRPGGILDIRGGGVPATPQEVARLAEFLAKED